jgi:hypothetical protein
MSPTRGKASRRDKTRIGVAEHITSIAVVGGDPTVTAQAALGLARTRAVTHRVTLVDLTGGAPPLAAVVPTDDPHGVSDCFTYGISFGAVTRWTSERNVYVIRSGTEPLSYESVLPHPRWQRLLEAARVAGEQVVFLMPMDVPGARAFLGRMDRVIPADPAASEWLAPPRQARRRPWEEEGGGSRRSRIILIALILVALLIGLTRLLTLRAARESAAAPSPPRASPRPARPHDTSMVAESTGAPGSVAPGSVAAGPSSATDAPPPFAASESVTATPAAAAPDVPVYVVQFVATTSPDTARSVAARVRAGGADPYVVSEPRKRHPLFRVILGPYPTSAAADSAGRASRAQYWVRSQNP